MSDADREIVARFTSWVILNGVPTPVGAADIADYLISQMMSGGAQLQELQVAANALETAFDAAGVHVDRRLIKGALALCADMLSHRTIN
jgi:hypothetical protein